MRHLRTLSRSNAPASAAATNVFDCLSLLVNTGSTTEFKNCLNCKFGIGAC